MGNFGGNEEGGVEDTHWIYEEYYGEAGTAEGRQDVGDSQCRNISVGGMNPVRNDLHWNKSGEGGIVGGAASNFLVL